MATPYFVTDKLRRRLGSDDYPRRGMNRVSNDAALGDRIRFLNSDGSYGGPLSDAVPVIGGVGGVAINDIVYVSGYDATTGYRTVDKAKADDPLTCADLFWAPAAILAGATGYVRRTGMFVSTLTAPANIGDPVYLSAATAGLVTETIPAGANYVREVGSFLTTGGTDRVHIDLGGEDVPVHTHADNSQGGALTAPALTGTTNATWTVDSGGAGSPMIVAADIGGATGFSLTLQAASIATGSRVLTFEDPGGADGMVYKALAQTLTNKTIAGTYGTSFTVFQGGATARFVLDTAGAGGNFTHTMVVPTIGGNVSNTLPTGTGAYYALTANADGSITTAALTGTTNVSFEVDTGNAVPAMAISADAGGTGDFTVTLMPADPITVDRTILFPDADDTVALLAATQTLTNKTINGGTLSGTIGGAATCTVTWANLGTVATIDINGGTIDGTVIGGAVAAAVTGTTVTGTTVTDGSFSVTAGDVSGVRDITSAAGAYFFDYSTGTGLFKTSTGQNTLSGDVEIVANKDLVLLAGTGYFQVNASVSGGIKILPTATMGFEVTIDSALQSVGVGLLGIPDLANGNYDFVVTGTAQSIAGVKTFTSVPVVPGLLGQDDPLDITGITGVAGNGGAVTVAGGIANGAGNTGGLVSLTSGAGIAGAGGGVGGPSGAIDLLTGAPGTETTGTAGISGAVTIASGAGAIANGIAGTGGDSGILTLGTGDGGAGSGSTGTGGAAGALTMSTGTGGAAGHASVTTGGVGGALGITAGDGGAVANAGAAGGDGGAMVLTTGTGGAGGAGTQGDGGAFTITVGAGNTNGAISIGATNAASIGLGRTGIDTTITGQLFLADETGADDILDVLTLSKGHNAAAGGVGTGVGISIRLEDATGYEEKASIDFVTTDATQATSDVDFNLSLNVGGAITQMMSLDADDGTASRLILGADTFRCGLEMHPGTTASGTLFILPADNAADHLITITNASHGQATTLTIPDVGAATGAFVMNDGTNTIISTDTHTGILDISGATVTYRAIINADIDAAAAIARSKMAEDALQIYSIPIHHMRNEDGDVMDLTGAAADFKVVPGGWGSGTLTMDGNAATGAAITSTLMYEFVLPAEYVDNSTVHLIVKATETVGAATVATTLSAQVYESDGNGGVGADLYNAFDVTDIPMAWTTCTSVITSGALVRGDRLIVLVRIVANDGGGAVGTVASVGAVEMRIDIKG